MKTPPKPKLRNLFAIFILSLLTLFSSTARKVEAAPKAVKWLFTNQKELQQTISTYVGNPRANYYIIMRANKLNLAGEACLVYRKLLLKDDNDPYLQAAYGFSHYFATGPLSPSYLDYRATPVIRQLRDLQGEASSYSNRASQRMPNSADVVLMTSLPLLYQHQEATVNGLRKAVQLDPKWADAHYWLGRSLEVLGAYASGEDKKALALETVTAYTKAEKLQPALRSESLYGRWHAYQDLDQPRLEQQAFRAYIKLNPKFLQQPSTRRWLPRYRQDLRQRLAKAQKAA